MLFNLVFMAALIASLLVALEATRRQPRRMRCSGCGRIFEDSEKWHGHLPCPRRSLDADFTAQQVAGSMQADAVQARLLQKYLAEQGESNRYQADISSAVEV